jgi:hypothetical protein
MEARGSMEAWKHLDAKVSRQGSIEEARKYQGVEVSGRGGIGAWKHRARKHRGVDVSRRGSIEAWKYRGVELWRRCIMEARKCRGGSIEA